MEAQSYKYISEPGSAASGGGRELMGEEIAVAKETERDIVRALLPLEKGVEERIMKRL